MEGPRKDATESQDSFFNNTEGFQVVNRAKSLSPGARTASAGAAGMPLTATKPIGILPLMFPDTPLTPSQLRKLPPEHRKLVEQAYVIRQQLHDMNHGPINYETGFKRKDHLCTDCQIAIDAVFLEEQLRMDNADTRELFCRDCNESAEKVGNDTAPIPSQSQAAFTQQQDSQEPGTTMDDMDEVIPVAGSEVEVTTESDSTASTVIETENSVEQSTSSIVPSATAEPVPKSSNDSSRENDTLTLISTASVVTGQTNSVSNSPRTESTLSRPNTTCVGQYNQNSVTPKKVPPPRHGPSPATSMERAFDFKVPDVPAPSIGPKQRPLPSPYQPLVMAFPGGTVTLDNPIHHSQSPDHDCKVRTGMLATNQGNIPIRFKAVSTSTGSSLPSSPNKPVLVSKATQYSLRGSLGQHENLPPSYVTPVKKFHGLCWCCYAHFDANFKKYVWDFDIPQNFAARMALFDNQKKYRETFAPLGSDPSKIDFASVEGHGMCFCCYSNVNEQLMLPYLSFEDDLETRNSSENDDDDEDEEEVESIEGNEAAIEFDSIQSHIDRSRAVDDGLVSRYPSRDTEGYPKEVPPPTRLENINDQVGASGQMYYATPNTMMFQQNTNPVFSGRDLAMNVTKRPRMELEPESNFQSTEDELMYLETRYLALKNENMLRRINSGDTADQSSTSILTSSEKFDKYIAGTRVDLQTPLSSKGSNTLTTSKAKPETSKPEDDDIVASPNREREFRCWFCSKTYKTMEILKNHLWRHGIPNKEDVKLRCNKNYLHGRCYFADCKFDSTFRDLIVEHLILKHDGHPKAAKFPQGTNPRPKKVRKTPATRKTPSATATAAAAKKKAAKAKVNIVKLGTVKGTAVVPTPPPKKISPRRTRNKGNRQPPRNLADYDVEEMKVADKDVK